MAQEELEAEEAEARALLAIAQACLVGDDMVADIIAGLGAFKTMFDIAKSMKDVNDTVKINAAVADLWEQIITAQARYTAAIEQVDELKAQLTRFETWETEKQRYELVELHMGSLAYSVKELMRGNEPAHYICPNCYQQNKKSILQGFHHYLGRVVLTCPACSLEITQSYKKTE